jgi:uncharacterized protein with FMN-binding domain
MKKIIIFMLTAALILSLSACSFYSYTPMSNNKIFNPGTYIVTTAGVHGDVKVSVKFNKSRVTKIEVLEQNESAGLGDAALQTVADEIIKNQSFAVDTVSGATYSSVAMLQAVAQAAKAAGAKNVPDISVDSLSSAAGTDEEYSGGYTPGTYTATVKGYHGDVTVKVTVDKTKITAVTAEGLNETAGVGSRAIEQLPDAIVKANSAKVDGVSGATMTSNAVKSAVKAALEQAH